MPQVSRISASLPTARIGVATSAGLRRIAGLERFVDLDEVVSPRELAQRGLKADCVLVWGRKPSADEGMALAQQLGVPAIRLEDGWIRSASKDAHAPRCYSLLVDRVGVYYDASSPSEIERFLSDDHAVAAECDAATMARAMQARRAIVDEEITKYNYCRTAHVPTEPFVLVVDQTMDDESVRCGGMDAERFKAMLHAAIEENPDTQVIVRTHPDVVAGRRAGYLDAAALKAGVRLASGDDNPMSWLKRAERIYVGTSQLGYEALLAERPVTIFGLPFYAGWGLADERQIHPGRGVQRQIDELFHAAHIRLARYVSPVTGEAWTIEQCIEHVRLQKAMFLRNARNHHCVGISLWKRGYLADFLKSPDGSVSFGAAERARNTDTRVTWSFRRLSGANASQCGSLLRVEDGFLRSSGLGSDFTAPGSLVFDASGLYFDSSAPSDLETLLNEHDCTVADLGRAKLLREQLLADGLTKYNLTAQNLNSGSPPGERVVLVTGQVEDDESIKRGTSEVATNAALLRSVRKRCPDDWIIYRPHPDVEAGNRRGSVDGQTLLSCADTIDMGSSIVELIEMADEVHTMTSLSGFEALLRQRKVVTWGAPFYAGWGLTEDVGGMLRRKRRRSLDELVYLALIAYPRYIDHVSGEFIDAETQARLISRRRLEEPPLARQWHARPLMRVRNLIQGIRHAA